MKTLMGTTITMNVDASGIIDQQRLTFTGEQGLIFTGKQPRGLHIVGLIPRLYAFSVMP